MSADGLSVERDGRMLLAPSTKTLLLQVTTLRHAAEEVLVLDGAWQYLGPNATALQHKRVYYVYRNREGLPAQVQPGGALPSRGRLAMLLFCAFASFLLLFSFLFWLSLSSAGPDRGGGAGYRHGIVNWRCGSLSSSVLREIRGGAVCIGVRLCSGGGGVSGGGDDFGATGDSASLVAEAILAAVRLVWREGGGGR